MSEYDDDCLVAKRHDMELIYSPDEEVYYWQRYSDWFVSQSFESLSDAMKAHNDGNLEWQE